MPSDPYRRPSPQPLGQGDHVNRWRPLLPPPATEPGDIAKFAVTVLRPEASGSVAIRSLHEPYREWCVANGYEPVAAGEFSKLFLGLCQMSDFAVRRGLVLGLGRAS